MRHLLRSILFLFPFIGYAADKSFGYDVKRVKDFFSYYSNMHYDQLSPQLEVIIDSAARSL